MCRSRADGGRRCNGHVAQGPDEDEERYLARIEQLKHTEDVGALMAGEKLERDTDAASEVAARIRAETAGDTEQWQ